MRNSCVVTFPSTIRIILKFIPSYCHLPVSCRSLVDRCGSLGSCKPQIYLFYKVKILTNTFSSFLFLLLYHGPGRRYLQHVSGMDFTILKLTNLYLNCSIRTHDEVKVGHGWATAQSNQYKKALAH